MSKIKMSKIKRSKIKVTKEVRRNLARNRLNAYTNERETIMNESNSGSVIDPTTGRKYVNLINANVINIISNEDIYTARNFEGPSFIKYQLALAKMDSEDSTKKFSKQNFKYNKKNIYNLLDKLDGAGISKDIISSPLGLNTALSDIENKKYKNIGFYKTIEDMFKKEYGDGEKTNKYGMINNLYNEV